MLTFSMVFHAEVLYGAQFFPVYSVYIWRSCVQAGRRILELFLVVNKNSQGFSILIFALSLVVLS